MKYSFNEFYNLRSSKLKMYEFRSNFLCGLVFFIIAAEDNSKSSDLETLIWDPSNKVSPKQVDQFLVISRFVSFKLCCDRKEDYVILSYFIFFYFERKRTLILVKLPATMTLHL